MREKYFYLSVMLLLVVTGFYLGFNVSDPFGSRNPQTQTDSPNPSVINPDLDNAGTVVYVDSLNGANDTTALKNRGYKVYYRGSGPQGTTATWFQGNSTVFAAFNGPATGYVAANYNVVTGANNIDSWLVLPRLTGGTQAGDSLYFYSRGPLSSTFPDSIRVMYSANDSVPEGTWTELGRFKVNTAGAWERRGYRAPTASANGRFAIRYNVVNGGPNGANSDFIGVDMITIERTAAPPPPSSWFNQTSGTTNPLYTVSAVTNEIVWAAGGSASAPTVIRTTNGGTWTNATGTGIGALPIYNIWGIDANTALATGSSATGTFVYRTSNGGTTWTQVFSQTGGFINVILMTDANNGWMQGDPIAARWSLWRTTNGGATWDSTGQFLPQAGSEAGWNNSAMMVGTNIWFGTNNSKIYYSSNNGTSWTSQALGELNSYAVWFNNSSVGLAGGTNMRVTTNGGSTWGANTYPGTGNISGITGLGNDWWGLRTTTAIYYTSNNGTSWAQQHTGTGAFNHITKARNGFMLYAVGATGAVSKYGPTTDITPINTTAPSEYKLAQNYPNPFNPTTKINFSIPQAGFTTLKVYDVLGKEVATLVSNQLAAGTYAYEFNATNLTSGVYFYSIQSNGFTETKRMMLIK